MASGWNLWVWLQCIGVVSRCCCKVYRSLHMTYPYSTCISSFFASSIPTSLFILKMFFILVYQTLPEEHSRLFKNRDHVDMVI